MQAVERRIGDIWLPKGGLAWLLWQEGRVVNTVVKLGVAGSLEVYRKEVTEGEHNK